MSTFEIWFDDLCSDAKSQYFEFQDVDTKDELNVDLAPLPIVEQSEDIDE